MVFRLILTKGTPHNVYSFLHTTLDTLIWETLNHEPMLDERAAAKASAFLNEYSLEKGIYMKINYFNADHTHALIHLPTRYSIEEVIKLFKGGSSYWINHSKIIKGKFPWGGGYGAFSVWNGAPRKTIEMVGGL